LDSFRLVAGHLTLFVARIKKPFFWAPFPAPILLGAILGTQVLAALIAGLGFIVTAFPWIWILWVWLYCLFWIFIEDGAKLAVYRYFDKETAWSFRSFMRKGY
jgi:H+-transporting ATPase